MGSQTYTLANCAPQSKVELLTAERSDIRNYKRRHSAEADIHVESFAVEFKARDRDFLVKKVNERPNAKLGRLVH